jgi:hypothetical protein
MGGRSTKLSATATRPSPVSTSHSRKKLPKRVLALPDLEHVKTAVLNSLDRDRRQSGFIRLRDYSGLSAGAVAWSAHQR